MSLINFKDIPNSDKIISDVLWNELYELEDISAIQIGAGCGGWELSHMGNQSPHINDPVWKLFKAKKSWRIALFEPVISEFKKCVDFYLENSNVEVFNACVVDHNHLFQPLYIRKAKSMSSLNLNHRKNDEYSIIEKETISLAVNINKIISEYCPFFVQIDTEGLDKILVHEILKGNILPEVISFEWCFENSPSMQFIYDLLLLNGYNLIFKSDFDVVFSINKIN